MLPQMVPLTDYITIVRFGLVSRQLHATAESTPPDRFLRIFQDGGGTCSPLGFVLSTEAKEAIMKQFPLFNWIPGQLAGNNTYSDMFSETRHWLAEMEKYNIIRLNFSKEPAIVMEVFHNYCMPVMTRTMLRNDYLNSAIRNSLGWAPAMLQDRELNLNTDTKNRLKLLRTLLDDMSNIYAPQG